MKTSFFILLFIYFMSGLGQSLKTPYEEGNGNETATYQEGIAFWRELADLTDNIQLREFGETDSGLPLHAVIYQPTSAPSFTLLINNGIHPGEPDGIDASMMLLRDMVLNDSLKQEIEGFKIVIIPFYNVGGALNRNSYSRANQMGPESYGFRGNARNLDLNRDFIKSDSKNARAFAQIFHTFNPDFFIDTHVSNGADHQYTITIVETQHNKLGGKLGPYFREEVMPAIHGQIETNGGMSIPYVNVFGRTPDQGYSQFFDGPRYSTGYAALFSTPGIMLENHMLKPYPQRVNAAYLFLHSVIQTLSRESEKIKRIRDDHIDELVKADSLTLNWQLDRSQSDTLLFRGYEGYNVVSNVTGLDRLYYDHERPYQKSIPYFNRFTPKARIQVPQFYAIPRAWYDVIALMKLNDIQYNVIAADTVLATEIYYIEKYSPSSSPYEGHFYHREVELRKETEKVQLKKGDILIPTRQPGIRYIVETLEPEAPDSFFRWNFFDPILGQKEYFSSYVFEDIADSLLQADPLLKKRFTEMKEDEDFRESARRQLDFIYRKSPFYEASHLRYPVYRIP